ncbi:Hpt domain-containing protein [Bradyrhizobium sp.]|uniref:Hpt domain-containing protein n=1 Tax=Bradyrhizobium sp. TaxID=376 RepID=UPI0025B8ECE8|nr:Hpt domain-containing protein [Bradyrhizobium sp.]
MTSEVGREGAAEIGEVFKSETEARLQRFRLMSPGQQRSKVEREAHSLKSAAGSVGYRRLAKLALQLEINAAQLTGSEYLDLLEQMDAAFAAAMTQEEHR